MDATLVEKKFAKIGARAAVRPLTPARARQRGPFLIDIGHDRDGEFFDIQGETSADLSILDVQPQDRHLLLMLRIPSERNGLPDTKNKFLCGHDERHWFVAAVPSQGVSSVLTAKEALKPDLVRTLERRNPGRRKNRHRRRNEVFTRQGEWFFLPARSEFVDPKRVLRNEPLQRAGGSLTTASSSTATEGSRFTSARSVRMDSPRRNTSGCSSGIRRLRSGSGA